MALMVRVVPLAVPLLLPSVAEFWLKVKVPPPVALMVPPVVDWRPLAPALLRNVNEPAPMSSGVVVLWSPRPA